MSKILFAFGVFQAKKELEKENFSKAILKFALCWQFSQKQLNLLKNS